jgi:hypothetical protein
MKNIYILLLFFCAVKVQAKDTGIAFNSHSSKLQFAAKEIENGLQKKGIKAFIYSTVDLSKLNTANDNIVLMSLQDNGVQGIINQYKIQNIADLKEEGFVIHITSDSQPIIFVIGYDDAGAMYGGLEVAELKHKIHI